jgi:hypothetical protein
MGELAALTKPKPKPAVDRVAAADDRCDTKS